MIGPHGQPGVGTPNHYNRSLWGFEEAIYNPDIIASAYIIAHEVGRVYCEQTIGPEYDDEKDLKPIEQQLLKEAPPPFSF
jgi:hypothetical protein